MQEHVTFYNADHVLQYDLVVWIKYQVYMFFNISSIWVFFQSPFSLPSCATAVLVAHRNCEICYTIITL